MIVIAIIALTAVISLLALKDQALFDRLCLYPYQMHQDKTGYFRFVTVGFVHADIRHLLFNMLTLWFFGRQLEQSVFSETQFLLFYVSALMLSGVHEYQRQKNNKAYRACGASGAVSAVLFSLVLFEPWGVVYLKFIIPVYFILFAAGYLLYSWYMSGRDQQKIAHGVHLWGALYGIAFTLLIHPESLDIFFRLILHPPFLN